MQNLRIAAVDKKQFPICMNILMPQDKWVGKGDLWLNKLIIWKTIRESYPLF